MADLSDFLNKLGLNQTVSQYPNSPLDEQAPDDSPINKIPAEPADSISDSLNSDSKPAKNPQLMSQKDIDAIHAIPLSKNNSFNDQNQSLADEIQSAAKDSDIDLNDKNMDTQSIPEKTLDLYSQLKAAQQKATDDNSRLGWASVIGQIGQAIAAGRGGKAFDNSKALELIRDQNNQPVVNIQNQIAELPKTVEIDRLQRANDPDSDISTFAREQAANIMVRMSGQTGPEAKQAALDKIKNMSALDLEKMGFKGITGAAMNNPFSKDEYINKATGNPVLKDNISGAYIDSVTRQPVASGNFIRPIGYIDPVTGQRGLQDLMTGRVGPGGVASQTANKQAQTSDSQTPQPTNVTLGQINQESPKIFKEYVAPIQNALNKDPIIEAARKNNLALNTLLTKLQANNGVVDSGIKEALAAQLATLSTGGNSRVAEAVIREFGGSGGIENKIKRYLSENGPGQMTPEDIKFFRDFGLKFKQASDSAANDAMQTYVDRLKMTPGYEGKIDDANAKRLLSADSLTQNTMYNKAMNGADNLVTIRGPSGQTVQMTKANAQKYLNKPGYQLVQ